MLQPVMVPFVKRKKNDAADAEAICDRLSSRVRHLHVVSSRAEAPRAFEHPAQTDRSVVGALDGHVEVATARRFASVDMTVDVDCRRRPAAASRERVRRIEGRPFRPGESRRPTLLAAADPPIHVAQPQAELRDRFIEQAVRVTA